ncbi:MAG TPA: flagellar hook-associated protein FlgL [Syntrophomonas sp.]|nr:flagellar hook-associated protein FlgL [Syntrophomonas sp.]
MFRVTNNMLINTLNRNLNTNMHQMEKYNRQLTTTRKINTPSDNPAGLIKSLRLRTDIIESEQYLRNIGEVINFMETTDSSLNDIGKILHRVRELTVKAANGTNDETALGSIADEVRELTDQLKVIANSTYGNKHIFGGTNVTEKPLQEDAGNLIWTGNDEALEVEIATGIKFQYNVTNGSIQKFFMGEDAPADITTDTGIIGVLTQLEADIRNGEYEEISNTLDKIDNKMNDLLTARATIGAKVNRLELQKNRLEGSRISFTGLLSENEDADIAEVIMNLKMQENVYRASLAAGARIIQPTLIDFLR